MDAPAVADRVRPDPQRLGQRRALGGRQDLVVDRQPEPQRLQAAAKIADGLELSDFGIAFRHESLVVITCSSQWRRTYLIGCDSLKNCTVAVRRSPLPLERHDSSRTVLRMAHDHPLPISVGSRHPGLATRLAEQFGRRHHAGEFHGSRSGAAARAEASRLLVIHLTHFPLDVAFRLMASSDAGGRVQPTARLPFPPGAIP